MIKSPHTKTANINVRLYPELKQEAEKVFAYHGLSLHDAIIVFLNHACRAGGFPFEINGARWQDPISIAALEECNQFEFDKNIKRFDNAGDLLADCLSGEDGDE